MVDSDRTECVQCDLCMCYKTDFGVIFTCITINKQRQLIALNRQGTQQQRPELPTATLNWHASEFVGSAQAQ